MNTNLLSTTNPNAITIAAQQLKNGHPIIFPTDTVYGIGVLATSTTAVQQLYTIKARDLDKGIPLLIADIDTLDEIAHSIPESAQILIENFWPGPLTLIVPKQAHLPSNLTPNNAVAVRIPDHDVSRQIIRAAGGVVATTSANLSGHPPALTAQDALGPFTGRVAAIIDDGPSPQTAASTIIDCTQHPPRLLRPGPIPLTDLPLDIIT
ncbi:MAG TPA: L-threonylcarbamoyladenylate synthase [Anaerolineae bacterium]|nr:L-threonylcarbamoyladenylate synthase [Anaerolineae bacterium]